MSVERVKILGLYRHLLREIHRLPKDVQEYYFRYMKQNFISHKDEVDPERIDEMTRRSTEYATWVRKKVDSPRHASEEAAEHKARHRKLKSWIVSCSVRPFSRLLKYENTADGDLKVRGMKFW